MSLIKDDIWMGTYKKKDDPELFEMEEIECFDIDYQWQFDVAKILYNNLKL